MLKIRRARQEDCHSIGIVHAAAVSGIRTGVYTPEEIQAWAVPKKPESYEESIRIKEFFVAEDEGVIVGFGVLNQEVAEVEAVYVSPEAGRRGIGLELLRKLEERASDLGIRELRLNASLNAVPFYEKAGYVAQERSKYRLLTGVEIACIPMVKALTREPDNQNSDNKTQCGSGAIESAKLIWDEYKYRHEHCWKLIFQITIAVVIISIIPYSQVHVGERLKEWIVLLPLVGCALTIFGLARLNGEMKILDKLRIRHREIQSELHGIEYGKEAGLFSRHVHRYLVFMLILEVINAIVLLFLWIN